MFVRAIEAVIYKRKIMAIGDTFDADDTIAESLIERKVVEPAEPVPFEEPTDEEPVEEEAVGEEPTDEEPVETVKAKWDKDDLMEWDYAEIKKLASDLGIKAVGKKEELIEKICEVEVEIPLDEIMTEDELPATGMPEDL